MTDVPRSAETDTGEDDRPPICPACGVTMGIVGEGPATRHVCLECGFPDEPFGPDG